MSDTIGDSEGRARVLWHTLWFNAVESLCADPEPISVQDSYGMSGHERRDYNEWLKTRDFDAERSRHQAVFDALAYFYTLLGYDVGTVEQVRSFTTFDEWTASVS